MQLIRRIPQLVKRKCQGHLAPNSERFGGGSCGPANRDQDRDLPDQSLQGIRHIPLVLKVGVELST